MNSSCLDYYTAGSYTKALDNLFIEKIINFRKVLCRNVCTTVEKKRSHRNLHSVNLSSQNTCIYLEFSDSEGFNLLLPYVLPSCTLVMINIPGRDI